MMDHTFYVTEDLYADRGARILNFIIDYAARYVFFLILGLALGLSSGITGNNDALEWIEDLSTVEEYLLGTIFMLLYYNVLEILFSRTAGKFITGTILVDVYGEKPHATDILKRTFCRLIPFDFLGFFNSPSRGWHDSIPGLYVVNKKLLEEAKQTHQDFNEFGNLETAL